MPVTIRKDMGKEVEILNGLHGSEPLVSGPSDLLNEGAIMSKCADCRSINTWNTQTVAMRIVETVVAGLLILMMAA